MRLPSAAELAWTQQLTCRVNLIFRDGQPGSPAGIARHQSREMSIQPWQEGEPEAFVAEFKSRVEDYYADRFYLVPPPLYRHLQDPRGPRYPRPVIFMTLEMDCRSVRNSTTDWREIFVARYRIVQVYRTSQDYGPGADTLNLFFPGTWTRTFRSTALHEVTHLLGISHPGSWPHIDLPQCRTDRNASVCYVVDPDMPVFGNNVVGRGRGIGQGTDLLPYNAKPWIEGMVLHTRSDTQEGDWAVGFVATGDAYPRQPDQPITEDRPLAPGYRGRYRPRVASH